MWLSFLDLLFYSCTCIQWQRFNVCCLMLILVCFIITLIVMSVCTSDELLLYVYQQCYQIWRRHLAFILRCVQVNSITVMLHRLALIQTLQWTGSASMLSIRRLGCSYVKSTAVHFGCADAELSCFPADAIYQFNFTKKTLQCVKFKSTAVHFGCADAV